MLRSTQTCSAILEPSQLNVVLLAYTYLASLRQTVFRSIQIKIVLYVYLLRYAQTYLQAGVDVLRLILLIFTYLDGLRLCQLCLNLFKHTLTCLNLLRPACVCLAPLRPAYTELDLLRLVQTCLETQLDLLIPAFL